MLQNDNYFQLYDLNHFCLGCKDLADCKIIDGCPNRQSGSVCYKYGCCNTSLCVANYTLGSFFDKPSPSPGTPTPSVNVMISTVKSRPIKKSSSSVLVNSPSPATKETMMSSSVNVSSKPTNPNHSGRVFSLSAVVLIAIVVLCNLF